MVKQKVEEISSRQPLNKNNKKQTTMKFKNSNIGGNEWICTKPQQGNCYSVLRTHLVLPIFKKDWVESFFCPTSAHSSTWQLCVMSGQCGCRQSYSLTRESQSLLGDHHIAIPVQDDSTVLPVLYFSKTRAMSPIAQDKSLSLL